MSDTLKCIWGNGPCAFDTTEMQKLIDHAWEKHGVREHYVERDLEDLESGPAAPVISFTNEAGYEGLQTILRHLYGLAFRVRAKGIDTFDGKLLATANAVVEFLMWDQGAEDYVGKHAIIELDDILEMTYL